MAVRKDFSQLALDVVRKATGEIPREQPELLSARQEVGRKGGLRGGKGRAEKLSPERRAEIARKAAEARWKR